MPYPLELEEPTEIRENVETIIDWKVAGTFSALRGSMTKICLFAGLGVLLAAGGIAWLSVLVSVASCRQTATRMGLPFEATVLEGCLVQVHGQWVPLSNYHLLGNVD